MYLCEKWSGKFFFATSLILISWAVLSFKLPSRRVYHVVVVCLFVCSFATSCGGWKTCLGGELFHSQLKSLLLIRARCEFNLAQPWDLWIVSKLHTVRGLDWKEKKWQPSDHFDSCRRGERIACSNFMEMRSRLRSSLSTFLVILRKRFKEMKAPHTSWLEAINWQLPAWRNGQLEAGTEKVHACRLCLSTSKNFQTGEEKCLVFYSIWVSLCLFRSRLWWNAGHEWPQIPQRGSDFL